MHEDELIKAIREAKIETSNGVDNTALTAKEIAEATGIFVGRVRLILKKMLDSGDIEPVWVYRDNISTALTGRIDKRPGYRLK